MGIKALLNDAALRSRIHIVIYAGKSASQYTSLLTFIRLHRCRVIFVQPQEGLDACARTCSYSMLQETHIERSRTQDRFGITIEPDAPLELIPVALTTLLDARWFDTQS
jgi:hypothetical protein